MSDVTSLIVNQSIQSSRSQLESAVGISVLKKAEQIQIEAVTQILNAIPLNTYTSDGQVTTSGSASHFQVSA